MKSVCSIFNEVFGPVMYGPSSSHTAAPCRIGLISRSLLNGSLKKAEVCFDEKSSYAATYKFHNTDRGFVAGLLGIGTDEKDHLRAFDIMKERKIDIQFRVLPQENQHPNFALLKLWSEDDYVEVGSISTGGGAFEIVSVDGFEVHITGESWYTLVKNPEREPDLQNSAEWSEKKGERLLIVRTFSDARPSVPDGIWVRHCAPVLWVPAREKYELPFSSYKEAVAYGKKKQMSVGELGLAYEMARSGKTREELMGRMDLVRTVMRDSVYESMGGTSERKISGYYPVKSPQVASVLGKLPAEAAGTVRIGARAASVFEYTLAAGLVVAAPTGGSSGVIPSAVVCLGEDMGLSEDEVNMALFAAGLVGVFISDEATFGCEVAGCQAENGSASAMAAAGVAQILGGTLEQVFDSAAIALQNTLGLICDPVAAAYVPCVTRNSMAAVNAVSSAGQVVCGFKAHIPLDDTIRTMMQIGREMPPSFRCTGGGLNCCEAGCRLNEQGNEYIKSLL